MGVDVDAKSVTYIHVDVKLKPDLNGLERVMSGIDTWRVVISGI